ncbi:flagellar biosynthesis protein FliQ [Clostridium sp.]|uniref:flagellar biosynthesis protein FliQ n=1 Tax=Clostridium sp. TaxID=1506 RepID=UPI002FC7B435
MTDTMVIALIKDMIKVALMASAPILITATLVGLLISIFQATTQIQEQTLTFVPKILAVAVVGLLTASWMGNQLVSFTKQIFSIITNMGA